jgi:hypothetical protein
MAKPFKTLREEMTLDRRKRNQLRTEFTLFEMSLAEIRQHRWLANPDVAKNPTVATIATGYPDLQQDMLLSTLVNTIAEMGGTLKLVAQFPDEEIVINRFELESPALQI